MYAVVLPLAIVTGLPINRLKNYTVINIFVFHSAFFNPSITSKE
jgi:hypothetical protein